VEATTRWYLRNPPGADLPAAIEEGREGLQRLAAALGEIGAEAWHEERAAAAAALVEQGAPETLARDHAYGRALVHAPDVTAVARRSGRSVEDVARAFFLVDAELQLGWLERAVERLPVGTRTQRWALQAVRDDLLAVRRALAERALEEEPGASAEDAVGRFLDARGESRARLTALTRALAGEDGADLAGLMLVVRQLRALA
jgi:glutamate dehydrogenase